MVMTVEELQQAAKESLLLASREELAARLGVFPPVIDRYAKERDWPIARILAVLQACGKEVRFQVA